MGLDIIWSRRAAKGYSKILRYLDENWTSKEVENFENEVRKFLDNLSEHPHILEKSRKNNWRQGPINKHTMLTYSVNKKKNRLELMAIRSTKQKPLFK